MKRPTGEIKGRKKGTIKARELLRYEKKRQGKQVLAARRAEASGRAEYDGLKHDTRPL